MANDVQMVYILFIGGKVIDLYAERNIADRVADKLRDRLPLHINMVIEEWPIIGRVK